MPASDINITVNESGKRFQTPAGNELAYIDFQWQKDVLLLLYVYVPIPSRGKGYSKALIEFALQYAQERKVKVKVYCSFISRYLQVHPELAADLV